MKKNRPARPSNVPKPVSPRGWPLALGLFLLVLAAFWAGSQNGFTDYDDPIYVTANAHVQQGLTWAGVKWAFITGEATNWHPLTWLSHELDYQWSGANPRGHHLTSIFLHAANAALLFMLLLRMTGAKWRSVVVAGLFGLHPLRVESVAWVSERKDVLSAFFFLLTLLAYVRYAEQLKIKNVKFKMHYGLALVWFALGLLSKPMLVTGPFLLLLLDFWPLGRSAECGVRSAESNAGAKPERRPLIPAFSPIGGEGARRADEGVAGKVRSALPWSRLVLEKVPFLLLAVGSAVTTVLVQKAGGAVSGGVPLGMRLQTVSISYARYLGKMFWPAGLAIEYPYPHHWPVALLVFSLALVIGVSVWVVWTRRRQPYLMTGWFWYLGMLVPVIGLVQVGVQSMADRYTYLPGIGILIMVVWGAEEWTRAWRGREKILGAVAVAAAFACVALTQRQIGFWRDSGTLFGHALEVIGKSEDTLIRLADYDREHGRVPEAIELYREAIELNPRLEMPQSNVGVLLYTSGQKDEAIRWLEDALKVLPDSGMLHGNLGVFLSGKGRLDEAAAHLEAALKLRPDYPEAHVVLGDICARSGRREEAIEHYRAALKLRPNFPAAERRLRALGPG